MFEQSKFEKFSCFDCFLGAWAAVFWSFSAVRKAKKSLTNQKKNDNRVSVKNNKEHLT